MNFTQAIVQALTASATGEVFDASKTAAVETASGFWARAFAIATVTPNVISPQDMSQIGRDLVRNGESIWMIEVVDGQAVLVPTFGHNINGGRHRSSWIYDLQIPAPSNNEVSQKAPWNQVCHFMYSYDKAAPWLGISPLTWAIDTAMTMGASEQRMKEESGTPTGYVIPVPEEPAVGADEKGNSLDPLAPLRVQITQLAGGIALVESTQGGFGEGPSARPQQDWAPRRLGANPPQSLIHMRQEMQQILLAACGVPPALASTTATQTASRESWRQFLHGTIQPVATLVEAELRIKLNQPDLTIRFDRLFASDIQGRARAFKAMVDGGMDMQKAAIQSGILEPEV